jgi:hypothetical protein
LLLSKVSSRSESHDSCTTRANSSLSWGGVNTRHMCLHVHSNTSKQFTVQGTVADKQSPLIKMKLFDGRKKKTIRKHADRLRQARGQFSAQSHEPFLRKCLYKESVPEILAGTPKQFVKITKKCGIASFHSGEHVGYI